ncbi:MAG: hypothetical protein CMJ58_17865 [Planctomycetaceae bacterium]|nr:hypothetical protein [Planctomycetaceae bacterium]
MTLPPEQIDWIVREVIRRLQQQGVSLGEQPTAAGNELALSERVVTTATLERSLGGVALVRVAKGAVVTPAARDLLRENNIDLVREG